VSTDSRWRIKQFSAIVDVSEATLRAWERRYGLLDPERSAGGFRLYSAVDEMRIRAMQAHMADGVSPAQAAALALAETAGKIVPPARPGDLVAELVAAAQVYDAMTFDQLLDAAFSFGRLTAIRDVVLPALVAIGACWEQAEMSIGHEHFSSHLIERRLLSLAQGWEAGSGPLAVLACPAGERHTLGLVCFGLMLSDQGWRIAYLGADTPIGEIVALSGSTDADAVVLCARDSVYLTDNADAIAELGRRLHTIVAGEGASAEIARRLCAHLAEGDPVDTALRLAERPTRTTSGHAAWSSAHA
jgi:DNA-binding transcriptional MerR regulator/methanogenic corrinoid protein MtbC1